MGPHLDYLGQQLVFALQYGLWTMLAIPQSGIMETIILSGLPIYHQEKVEEDGRDSHVVIYVKGKLERSLWKEYLPSL